MGHSVATDKHELNISGVATAPADPTMRGPKGLRGPFAIGRKMVALSAAAQDIQYIPIKCL